MLMNDLSEYFPTDEQIEGRAVAHAFGLLAAVGDAKAAKVRLEQITAATKEYAEQRVAAEKIVAEADTKRAAAEAADIELAKKTAAFQTWVDGTERAYREREARILENEQICARRDADFKNREGDLARRIAEHDSVVRRMRELT
jgi:hypothetical protein